MAKGKNKKQGKAGKGRQQSQKSGPKGPSGPDTRVESVHKKIPGGHLFPVPGLTNLGNTCFFNAVLQNISQSHYLRVRLEHLVSSPSYTTELKISGSGLSQELTVADQPGQLTKALNSFLSDMAQHPGRSLNPRPLFSEICCKASRFSSFQQQDSQELLRYLLDSMRSEEINRIKRAILASFSVGKKDHKKVTDKDREDIKAYGHEADLAPTFVDEVFGGVLHSMMRETFLDLSLPIPEDKSQPKTPPGYQARGRKNKKGAEGAGYKIGKGKLDEEKALPIAKEAAMSKHQQKKARKEKTKGAKKSKSNTKSLQDFLRDGSEADATPNQREQAKSEEVERDNTPGNTEITRAERANATAELVLGGNDNDARESKNAGGNDDSTGKDDDDVESRGNDVNARSRENDGNAGEVIADNDNAVEKEGRPGVGTCAATGESGPLQPSSEEQPLTGNVEALADELATIQVADDCHNDTTLARESQQAVDLKENVVEGQSTPDIAQPGSDSQGAAASEEVATSKEAAASKGTSNAAISPDENIQLDSLQASLKKFCAPELLTGRNRFACIFCTKKKMEETNEQPISSQGRDTTGTAENDMEVGTNEEEERNLSQRAEKESSLEAQHRLLAPLDSHGEAEDEEESGPKSAGCKDAKQALKLPDNRLGEDAKDGENAGSEASSSAGEGGNREQSNEENSHEESTKESDDDDGEGVPKTKAAAGKGTEKVVFSEATKQLLIERPPLVLNLHMKRFLQSGRHLRKNNKHISFPTLLDMRPFCTPKCQPLCDSKGKLLYSLYGVVEHSGGMHGGHYTAYVRVRKPPTTSGCDPTTSTSTTSKGSPSKTVSITTECDPSTATLTTSKGSPSKTASTTSECDPNKTPPQTVQCDLPPHASNTGASIADTSTQVSTPNCATQCCSRTVEVAASEGENDRSFDLSSTMGHWYYISDGHVRTATESEVLKGQAYLLFYERLPFQHAD